MTASASVVEAAARRILDLMFFGGVSDKEAAAHQKQNTEQWQRSRAYADAALNAPQPAEQDAREAVARLREIFRLIWEGDTHQVWTGHPEPQPSHDEEGPLALLANEGADILSALTQAAPDGWKPIDTAPKDGAVIHVYAPGFDWPEAVLWEVYDPASAEEAGEDGYWTYAESLLADCTDSCEPEYWTHWRPLPAPPAQGAGS